MRRRKIIQKKQIVPTKNKTKKIFSRLRGMKDATFKDYKYKSLTEKKATELSKVYGFLKLDTPVMEPYSLFEKSLGKNSAIMSNQIFTFVDKNGEKIAIRPDFTPSIARAYIDQKMEELPQPVKVFSMGPVFRNEKLQNGRYRQFNQFNFDILGENNAIADSLLMLVAYNFFRELQIDVQFQVNSLGCSECQVEFFKKISSFYKTRGKKTKLCNECKKNIVKNPLALFMCHEKNCVEAREDAPQIVDYLCEPCKDHFIKTLEYLDELEVPYNLNPYLLKDLDYYNRTIFEIWPVEDEDKNNLALGGGGRYDNLIESMGGEPTPASGISIGVERTILKIREKNIPFKKDGEDLIFIAQLGEQARIKAMSLFEELRKAGFLARQSFTKNSLKLQLEDAASMDAKFSLILGQKEIMEETILFRDMESGIQEVVDYKKIRTELEKRLKEKK